LRKRDDETVRRLDGRVAIITGAGDGIGRGIARRFAAEGARVLIAEIDEATGERVAKELASEFDADARALRIDVSRKADILAMVEAAKAAWGTVHILVNNAWGGETLCGVERKTDEQIAHGLNVAFYGPLWAMQAVYPLMRAQR